MIDSCGGVVSTAKETVSIARFPAASAASTVMEWPCSERFVSEYEVASVARSTGAPESKESCRVATPDPESLAVQVTVTSFESAYESGGCVLCDPTQDVLVRPFSRSRRRDEDLGRVRVDGRVRLRTVEGLAAELLGHRDGRELVMGLATGVQGVEGDHSGDGAFLLGIVDAEPSPIRVPGRHVQ